jgi:ABC-2 type transport system ATP-binding protein
MPRFRAVNARVRLIAATAATLAPLAAALPAHARDAVVTSRDGTPIVASFHPAEGLAAGAKAPTVLVTHGWGGTRDATGDGATSEAIGNVGAGPLRRAGYNVLTWDSRGFGQSGGVVTVDHKDNEGRDVQALLDFVAQQPEAQLDGPGDPRAGMHGASYAGGIELVSAAIDRRIDVITPVIAWHSLLTSLYKEETVKGGWSAVLYAGGLPTSALLGVVGPAGIQTGNLDPHITSAFVQGAATGTLSAEDRAWFDSRGPTALVRQIRVPTLLVQGTADTLFTPSEAVRNYMILRRSGVPLKMVWFCGGHGVCKTGSGEAGHVERAVIAWLHRHLSRDRRVDTGPGFEWLADDARWRSAGAYPPPAGPAIVAEGSGSLTFAPTDALSGDPIAAGPAANAVEVPVPAPSAPAQSVGEPALTLTYSGTGLTPGAHVFAQIVDETRGVVVGNQVTPIPVTLDGRSHTVTRGLEGIAAALTPQSRLVLQIVGGSLVYGPVRRAGSVRIARARLRLPTVGGSGAGAGGGVLPGSRRCASRRSFVIRLKEPRRGGLRLRGTRVTVSGRRVKVFRRGGRLRARVNLRGRPRQRVRVKVVARTRSGRVLRDTRVYRTCIPTKKPKRKRRG